MPLVLLVLGDLLISSSKSQLKMVLHLLFSHELNLFTACMVVLG